MNLLIVTNIFHPDRGGGASVLSDMCYGLVERGHTVTVYTSYPYYPEWVNKSQANLWRITEEQIRGVKVKRFGLYVPKNPSRFIPRVTYELSFMLSLMRSLLYFRRFDAVMIYCPLLGTVAYGAMRRLLHREPTWLNVQDIPADAAAATGISKNRFFNSLAQYVQKFLFNRANVWSTIAPKMIDRLRTLTRHGQPIHFVPNFLNGSMAGAVASHPSKVGRAPQRPVKLLYAGNIGKKQDLVSFCQRLADSDFDFSFKIHGSGGESARVRDWVTARGDLRFQFGDFLDEAGFVGALNETDFFIITETPEVGASFIPSKLIPCIATGTPVACLCDPDGPLGAEVREFGLGITEDWAHFDQLLARLKSLLTDVPAFSKLQQNCIDRSQEYARGPVIDRVESELSNMVR
jgi:colanic acid biosynthesis glycosyl transferase WcaI